MAGMDFIKGLGNTISSAGKDGLNKAKEVKDSAKISLDIRERENAIRKMYRDLGKAYYQDHKDDISPEYSDRIKAIAAAFEEIGELKANLDEVRGIRRCPTCGKVIPPEAKFCAECGEKCEEEVVECEVVEDDEEETAWDEFTETAESDSGNASAEAAESDSGDASAETAEGDSGNASAEAAESDSGDASAETAESDSGSESAETVEDD